MLVDVQYLQNSKQLVVSYVNKGGDIKLKYFHWDDPFKYEVCDARDPYREMEYKSWDGKPVKKVRSYPDRYSIYEFLDDLPKEEQDEIFEYNEPSLYFIDIEVEVVDGFPEPKEAPTRIQSMSIVYDDKILILGQGDLDEEQQRICMEGNIDEGGDIEGVTKYFEKYDTNYQFRYVKYEDEFDMLYAFFYKMLPKMSCITGWNFIDFDWTFLVNRARKLTKTINGKEYNIDPRVSSFTRRLNNVWGTEYEVPAHKMIFDYMQLYQALDTSVKVKESSSLDFVSTNLLGVKKIQYQGSLMTLHDDDYTKFIYYNAVDSVLVQLIHQKMMYINVLYGVSSLSRIKVVDVYSYMNGALASLAITEGVLRGRFREQEGIVLFKDKTKNHSGAEGIAGGWVKDPNVGMNMWVACYDFASLYPTTQRQFFIAPENYKGVMDKKNEGLCITETGERVKINPEEDVVCTNGVVFRKRYSPTLQMLSDVYSDRKKFKKVMMSKKIEMEELQNELDELEAELENGI
ncbi:MAG: gp105 [uncultured marine phage]|uniref:DNA-directed DNA polymerase n=1 Tax=uncultured marine phage TaxID=707152 RepID=A0A8D9C8Q7_9VIRU|nr:MAG: gp105 [uncultured marine phage]